MNVELTPRDKQVLDSLGTFTQLDTKQLKMLRFPDVHRISMDRSIKRLRRHKLIRRVGVRAVGIKGGTAPGVYALTKSGWYYVGHTGRYKGSVTINDHALAVADLWTALVALDRAGDIKLLPESRLEYRMDGLRADIYLALGLPAVGKRRQYLVEVQRNARKDVISQKIEAHLATFRTYVGEGKYPRVAFVVWDEAHRADIKKMIPADRRDLFKAYMPDEFIREATAR